MNPRYSLITLAVIAALAGVGYAGYRFGQQGGNHAHAAPAETPEPADGRRVLYWHDPMVPGQRFDKPGRSPFMDMDLVPVYADAPGDEGTVAVSARQTQSLGLRSVAVQPGRLALAFETSGSVAWNERGLSVLQARNTAFVEKLFVRATLDAVRAGQPLAELYVPDWVAVQEEFLALRGMRGDVGELLEGARLRMRQAGMGDALIAAVEREGKVQARITLRAPQAGRVIELGVREGMTVMAGTTLFRINALDSVWVNAEVPESQAALLRPGAAVRAQAAGFPGEVFEGRVEAVLPEVEAATRTLRVRIVLANPGARLAPGMYVSLRFAAPAREALLIPQEALIRTGRRSVVMLAEGEGRYRPVEVEIGREAEGQVEITAGLAAGQQVVVAGQFLLDSEASLRAAGQRLSEAALPEYQSEAVFESVLDDMAMLTHPPIPELKWGAMTMGFKLPAGGMPQGLQPGQKLEIRFNVPESGEPQLTQVVVKGGGK